ncbi:hypothetical protein GWI33_001748 [Rhynchophorus ferrugineus]|uniref:Uncharacterized protein n=1 Tax=Rhynchophorus ferrugineus TaxID=354439 RepID=A0A834ISD7_RHYFE|nr:hypothetical protein GWI33_001748 [Rhynchophorus ferrugineus]
MTRPPSNERRNLTQSLENGRLVGPSERKAETGCKLTFPVWVPFSSPLSGVERTKSDIIPASSPRRFLLLFFFLCRLSGLHLDNYASYSRLIKGPINVKQIRCNDIKPVSFHGRHVSDEYAAFFDDNGVDLRTADVPPPSLLSRPSGRTGTYYTIRVDFSTAGFFLMSHVSVIKIGANII